MKLSFGERKKIGVNTRKYVFFIVFLLIILCVIYVFIKVSDKKREEDIVNATEYANESNDFRFPDIEEYDVFGRLRNSSEFKGKYIYVHFFKRTSQYNVAIIDSVLQKYKNSSDFAILYFFENDENVKATLFPNNNEIAISANYNKYINLFNAPECCESIYLFDKSGNQLSRKYYYSNVDTVTGLINEYYFRDKFILSKYISLDKYDKDNLLKPVVDMINQSKDNKFIIHMSTRICASCKSGYIIEALNRLNKGIKKKSNIIYLLVKNLSSNDIKNLKKHLSIDYEVIGLDIETEALWDNLINRYGQKYLGENVFIINKSGEVISQMDYDCNCDAEYLKKLGEVLYDE